ncbi:MAG: hypothetical protein ACHREM_02555 [Polyangiales bacterium]
MATHDADADTMDRNWTQLVAFDLRFESAVRDTIPAPPPPPHDDDESEVPAWRGQTGTVW